MAIDLPALALATGVGLILGWLSHIMSSAERGMLGSVVLGILGAMAGSYLFAPLRTRLPIGDPIVATILLAAIGAIIVLSVARLIRRS